MMVYTCWEDFSEFRTGINSLGVDKQGQKEKKMSQLKKQKCFFKNRIEDSQLFFS